MRFITGLFLLSSISSVAFAGLGDDCSITEQTSCVLNKDTAYAEFIVNLPNYVHCGVRFVSDTYPDETTLADFAEGLYVTAGPSWDTTAEQEGYFETNLTYPVGENPLFITLFSVYTRSGESLNDYVHSKLATTYQPAPTVSLQALPCY